MILKRIFPYIYFDFGATKGLSSKMGYDKNDIDFIMDETFKSYFTLGVQESSLEECRKLVINALG